jgi:hypothetical protein
MPLDPPEPSLQKLLRSLVREFFQTETSAVKHCRREAARLESAPAQPLRAIADHAERALREFPALANGRKLPFSGGGIAVGALFSELRDKLADKTIRRERSYRGTMLGVRHGMDLVRVLRLACQAAGYSELTQFCDEWLRERTQYVAQLEQSLSWFVEHPSNAMQLARAPLATA